MKKGETGAYPLLDM